MTMLIQEATTLQQYLLKYHLGKKQLHKIKEGSITFYRNDCPLQLDSYLHKGDLLTFTCDEDEVKDASTIPPKPLSIIYEDANIMIIEKEAGILVHSDGNTTDTLLNYATFYLQQNNDNSKLRPIHRLDFDTMGLVIFTKNIIAHDFLDYQMQNNLITKKYYAVVEGVVNTNGEINAPIGKDRHQMRYRISQTGKPAHTIYQPIKQKNNKTWLDIKILTGRTHQIRVHLASINHPIIGDKIYNPHPAPKMMLHAYSITFTDPFDLSLKTYCMKEVF